MQIYAGEWWEAGSWWQFVITVVISIAVGVLASWATLRASNPKRKFNWWVQSNTPLLSATQYSPGGVIDVSYQGVQLTNPRIVELVIANQGRRDITSAMFHGNEAIRFDFGADICTILDATTLPAGRVAPSIQAAPWQILGSGLPRGPRQAVGGTWLDLLPSLLSKGQVVTVTVLLDGEEKPVELDRFPLVDVDPVSEPPGMRSRALADAAAQTSLVIGPVRISARHSRP